LCVRPPGGGQELVTQVPSDEAREHKIGDYYAF
jgi:hypothetical protein